MSEIEKPHNDVDYYSALQGHHGCFTYLGAKEINNLIQEYSRILIIYRL